MDNINNINFDELKRIDIRTVDIKNLIELESLDIDTNLSYEEKLVEYVKQLKNPFLFRVGGFIIKQTFEEEKSSLTLEECIEKIVDNL